MVHGGYDMHRKGARGSEAERGLELIPRTEIRKQTRFEGRSKEPDEFRLGEILQLDCYMPLGW